MSKILILLLAIIIAGGTVVLVLNKTKLLKTSTLPSTQVSPTPTPTPKITPIAITIPKLKFIADVEHVGLTSNGNLDVPKNAQDVAWYKDGPTPGELGNAVIDGHYDTPMGRPAVFYYLKDMDVGDQFQVIFDDGTTKTFEVEGKVSVPFSNSYDEYVKYIFYDKPGTNLNLITCDGVWDSDKHTYSHRLVIYSSLKT